MFSRYFLRYIYWRIIYSSFYYSIPVLLSLYEDIDIKEDNFYQIFKPLACLKLSNWDQNNVLQNYVARPKNKSSVPNERRNHQVEIIQYQIFYKTKGSSIIICVHNLFRIKSFWILYSICNCIPYFYDTIFQKTHILII